MSPKFQELSEDDLSGVGSVSDVCTIEKKQETEVIVHEKLRMTRQKIPRMLWISTQHRMPMQQRRMLRQMRARLQWRNNTGKSCNRSMML
jgi:hypothetical protein